MSRGGGNLVVLRGLPGSGKTAWSTRMVADAPPGTVVRVSRDEIGRMLHGQRHHQHVTEGQISAVERATAEHLLRSGVTVIADSCNLGATYVRTLAEIAWRCEASVTIKPFDIPVDECIARDTARPDRERVGEAVIRGMHDRYLRGKHRTVSALPVPERPDTAKGLPYVPDLSRPKAVIVDVDGTVALHGSRDPYDTSRYHEDTPHVPVIAAVRAMYATGHKVVFCSGRDEAFRDVTEEWLLDHVGIPEVTLFMRPPGDVRRDDIVKLELFDEHIRDRWNVVCVFDDRARVVGAWRSIGLTVMAVADGQF